MRLMLGSQGRPREQAPLGYITVSDAAEILGVSSETIRNRVRNKTLDGKAGNLPSGERRYYVRKSAVEKRLMWNGAQRLPWGDQGPGVEELASFLDAIAERQQNIEKRQESIEDAVREVLASLQQQEQAAERERDELRELLTHSAYQATLPSSDTPVEVTEAQEPERTESPEVVHAESPEVVKKRGRRRIDGRKVQELREEKLWLTREQLAKKAGLHPITIGAIESGKRPTPRRDTVRLIAEVLGDEPEELVTRD